MIKSRRTVFFIVIIVLIFVVISAIFMFSKSDSGKAEGIIHVEEGLVKVNGEIVEGVKQLRGNDVIETGSDGLATIILYESVMISLDYDTRVSLKELIKEHPKIYQEKGSSWNTFTNVLGVEEYSIDTSQSVASVRGTSFGISESKILVGAGVVEYSINNEVLFPKALEVVEDINGKIVKRNASEIELEIIRKYMERAARELEFIKDNFARQRLSAELRESILQIDNALKNYKKLEDNEIINRTQVEVNDNEKMNVSNNTKDNRSTAPSQTGTAPTGFVVYPEQNSQEQQNQQAQAEQNNNTNLGKDETYRNNITKNEAANESAASNNYYQYYP